MRCCIRCSTAMIENLTALTHDGMGLSVARKGLLGGSLGKICVAVCPECGYTETYVESTDRIKKLK